MAHLTRVETTPSGTIYRAATSYEVPEVDLLTLLFDSPHCAAQEDTPLHISAADPSFSINKTQARDLTQRIAYGLRHHFGIGANGPYKDVVCCISTGDFRLPTCFYGVLAAGGVFSSASSASTPAELARQMRQGECQVLLCNADTREVAVAAARECGLDESNVVVLGTGREDALKRVSDGENIISERKLDWRRVTDKKELEDSLICLLYSSGTTGLPKGVCLSHQNLVAEAFIPINIIRERMARINPSFEYRTLGHLPTAHIAGTQGYFVNPCFQGGPVYWMPKFDFIQFLEYNKRYRITSFFTVPPIYLLIAKSPLVTDQFDSMEYAISGAAPLGWELQRAASRKLGRGRCWISQTWGLSETTGSVTVMPVGERDESGSVSPLMPNITARIIDDDEKDVPVGYPGELLIKGPVVCNGYHKNPQANKEAFLDGWFRTGDVGEFRNGLIYIVDRKKELIKYKGLQVAPAELEALLLSHPQILDAAVIGVEGEGTEVPRAYVVADQKVISGSEIQEFVAKSVASSKKLRGGVVFLDAIPKSPSGKILRRELREMARKETRAKL